LNRFLSAVVVFSMVSSGCGGSDDSPTGPEQPLSTQDLVVGTGATAVNGDLLAVHYIGSLQNGTVFQSSYGTSPYVFRLGTRAVIAGWDQGIPGMKVGGKRRLIIPPSLAYGSQGQNGIPPNSTLQFDVELIAIDGK
jgi:FKBP-type peptidyl-prolyl cis-trans isomerase FkpA